MTYKLALLGKEGEEFAENSARTLQSNGVYEIVRKNGNVYFRSSYEDKTETKNITFSRKITHLNYRDRGLYKTLTDNKMQYSFLTDYSPEFLLQLFKKHSEFDRFEKISKGIFHAGITQIPNMIIDVIAPILFNDYPDGYFVAYAMAYKFQMKLAALRILGSIDKFVAGSFAKAKQSKTYLALHGAQPSATANPSKYLTIPLGLSLPKPCGFVSPRITDGLAFFFGRQLADVRKPFPKSGIEYFRSSASSLMFENKNALTPSGEVDLEVLNIYGLLEVDFDEGDWWVFFLQYITKLDSFLHFMTDPGNFVDRDGQWLNLTHYLFWLSFERICDDVIFLLTEENHYLRKLAGFRILDQLASLGDRDSRKQVPIFNNLVFPAQSDPITDGIDDFKGKVASYLRDQLSPIREQIKRQILDGIRFGAEYKKNTSEVHLFDGTVASEREYVINVFRQLRNTSHGFSAVNNYLITNEGNIPDKAPLLSVIAFFAFLSKPENFLRAV